MDSTHSMTNICPHPFVRIKSVICIPNLMENSEFLTQKYCIEKLSARQIAVLIGCSHSTVNDALEELGIEREKRQTGKVPYGYRLQDGKRIPHIREQKTVKRINVKKAKGWSSVKISNWLNDHGIPSPGGGRWYPNAVMRLINV